MPYIHDVNVPADGNCLYSAVLVAMINGIVTGDLNTGNVDENVTRARKSLFRQIEAAINSNEAFKSFGGNFQTQLEWFQALIRFSDPYKLLEEIMVPILRNEIADYALSLDATDQTRITLANNILLMKANDNVNLSEVEARANTPPSQELSNEEFIAHFTEVRDDAKKRPYGGKAEFAAIKAMYGVNINSSFHPNEELDTSSQDTSRPTLYICNVGEHYHVGFPRESQQEIDLNQQNLINFCEQSVVAEKAHKIEQDAVNFDINAFNKKVKQATVSASLKTAPENILLQITLINSALSKEVFEKLSSEKKTAISSGVTDFIKTVKSKSKNENVLKTLAENVEIYANKVESDNTAIVSTSSSPAFEQPPPAYIALEKSNTLAMYEACCEDVMNIIFNPEAQSIHDALQATLTAFYALSPIEKKAHSLSEACNLWIETAIDNGKNNYVPHLQQLHQTLEPVRPAAAPQPVQPRTPISSPAAPLSSLFDKLKAMNNDLLVAIETQIEIYLKSSKKLEQDKGKFLEAILNVAKEAKHSNDKFSHVILTVKNQENPRWDTDIYRTGSTTIKLLRRFEALDASLTQSRAITFQSGQAGRRQSVAVVNNLNA